MRLTVPLKDLQEAEKRIAELEQELESCAERARQWDMHNCTTHAMNLAEKNRRLRDALIPVPDEMSLSQIEAWLERYSVKRLKALEDSNE